MTAAVVHLPAPGLRLTSGQERALAMIERVADLGFEEAPFAIVTGYAGTGKTTLLKLCEHLRPMQLAPTGKAALRLQGATGRDASTIHRAIYSVRLLPGGEFEFDRKGVQPPPGSRVILCDEASMVDRKVWGDLLAAGRAFRLPIVAIGDPFQLPPVAPPGAEPFSVLRLPTEHRVELTEVLRQALDSPIIAASMRVREGDVDGGLALLPVLTRGAMVAEAVRVHRAGGVVIVHRNATRHALNRAIRRELGRVGEDPQRGEPLLVMLNNYRVEIFNGEILPFAGWKRTPMVREFSGRRADVGITELGACRAVWLAVDGLHGRLDRRADYDLEQNLADEVVPQFSPRPLPVVRANFGYALTAHKSQGSEWDEVIVGMESGIDLDTVDGRQWAYTAITRAKERCSIAWGHGA